MKAATVVNDSDCTGMVAVSLYESKPVYFYQLHAKIPNELRRTENCFIRAKEKSGGSVSPL